jgi:hypothetical protein
MTERKHRLMVGVMVFTLFLWGISNACIAQETDKDNITLSVKDESVEKVLKRLGKETDFNFFYDPSVLNTVSLVTLDVRGASLQNIIVNGQGAFDHVFHFSFAYAILTFEQDLSAYFSRW